MKISNLKELLIQKINALYDIEIELTKALPKLAKAASDPKLKEALREHLVETRGHVARLVEVHEILGAKPKKLKAEGIRGIAKDGAWVIKNIKPALALDANLIRAAQYAEHYEIAGYMGAIAWANMLGETEVVTILNKTLGEEREGDRKLEDIGRDLDVRLT